MTSIYVACLVNSSQKKQDCRVAVTTKLETPVMQLSNSCYQLSKSHDIYFEKIDNNQHICEEVTVVSRAYLFEML